MKNFVRSYLQNEHAATAIEYALLAGGIALAIMSTVFVFGDSLKQLFVDMGVILSDVNSRSN